VGDAPRHRRSSSDVAVSPRPARWWTVDGWASHGSKLQTQLYVNRQPETLTKKVLEALPALAKRRPELEWVAPLEKPPAAVKAFAEPRDRSMLRVLRLERLASKLAKFWPARGPVWDALAIVHFADGTRGALLAEGKNYPRELYSGGTGAGKSGTDAALASRRQIELAIAWAQGRLGVPLDVARWLEPLDPKRPGTSLYQTANRLAYLVWLRSEGIDAWLCHLLFLDDPLHRPTSRRMWEEGLRTAGRELGIEGLEFPYVGHVFLHALDPEIELSALYDSSSGRAARASHGKEQKRDPITIEPRGLARP
jgi:hypothetical protein